MQKFRKKTGFTEEKMLFHQDNIPVYTAQKIIAKISELKHELVPHPPYPPDLARSDLWLFQHLKEFFRGKQFLKHEEVIAAVEEYFADLPESHYRNGINKLEDCWNTCIQVQFDYTEI